MQYREQILEILEKHECTATFFAIGENLVKNPELSKHIGKAGMFEKHQYVTS